MFYYPNIYEALEALFELLEKSPRMPDFYDEAAFKVAAVKKFDVRPDGSAAFPADLTDFWLLLHRFTFDYYGVDTSGMVFYRGANSAVTRFSELWNIGRKHDAALLLGMSGIKQERLDTDDSQAVYYKVTELSEPARSQEILTFARSLIPQLTERRNNEIHRALDDGFTQAEVARELGLTRGAINQIVNG